VVDPIKELFQIDIHHPRASVGDVALRRLHRLMRAFTRSKAEAAWGKRVVPSSLQNLLHRLLDETVQNGRDAKLAHPAIWLGNLHPSHRLCLVGSFLKLLFDLLPVQPEIVRQLLDGHPVYAGRSLVGLHLCQCRFQIFWLKHLLHD
jgi:hypothetical protein